MNCNIKAIYHTFPKVSSCWRFHSFFARFRLAAGVAARSVLFLLLSTVKVEAAVIPVNASAASTVLADARTSDSWTRASPSLELLFIEFSSTRLLRLLTWAADVREMFECAEKAGDAAPSLSSRGDDWPHPWMEGEPFCLRSFRAFTSAPSSWAVSRTCSLSLWIMLMKRRSSS